MSAVAAVGFACLTWLGIPQRAIGQAAQEVPSTWNLIPSGLSAGDSFRLLFVSSTIRDATSADIAVYNMHVQSAAANGHVDIQSYSAHFKVLGSTTDDDARDNTATTFTSSDPGVPVYWLDGEKVADDYSDFYDGDWDSNAPKTESGTTAASDIEVFTGSFADGTQAGTRRLGRPNGNKVRVGKPGTAGEEVDSGADQNKANELGFYALSYVFTVEAGTLGLSMASVDGGTLTLTYNQTLDTNSVPEANDFVVTVAGTERTVSDTAISGIAVTLELTSAVAPGETVTVTYTPGTTPIQNPAGVGAGSLTNSPTNRLTTSLCRRSPSRKRRHRRVPPLSSR